MVSASLVQRLQRLQRHGPRPIALLSSGAAAVGAAPVTAPAAGRSEQPGASSRPGC
jgi:hypothetical protein